MPAAGGEPVKLTAFPVGVDGFRLSPDGSRVAFSAGAFPDCKAGAEQGVLACTKAKLDEAEKSKATGMVFDRMFIRHWDTWSDGRMNRVFVADLPRSEEHTAELQSLMRISDAVLRLNTQTNAKAQ